MPSEKAKILTKKNSYLGNYSEWTWALANPFHGEFVYMHETGHSVLFSTPNYLKSNGRIVSIAFYQIIYAFIHSIARLGITILSHPTSPMSALTLFFFRHEQHHGFIPSHISSFYPPSFYPPEMLRLWNIICTKDSTAWPIVANRIGITSPHKFKAFLQIFVSMQSLAKLRSTSKQ